jgi:hypothetical protein
MNDRLRDKVGDADRSLARAAELVASVPAIAAVETRKQRVRRAVLASGCRRAWLPLLLRPSVVLALLLAAGMVAAATLGRSILTQPQRDVGDSREIPTENARMGASPKRIPEMRAELPVAAEAEPALVLPTVVPPPTAPFVASRPPNAPARASKPASPTAGPPAIAAPPPKQSAPEAATPTKAAPAQETALVMAAVRALRREHDPARAGLLLDDYLRRYPSGVLAEEALALAIEAASARGDARAAALARMYLARYPQGRFQHAARAAAE